MENWEPRGHLCHRQGNRRFLYSFNVNNTQKQMKYKFKKSIGNWNNQRQKVLQIENKNLKLKEKTQWSWHGGLLCTVHSAQYFPARQTNFFINLISIQSWKIWPMLHFLNSLFSMQIDISSILLFGKSCEILHALNKQWNQRNFFPVFINETKNWTTDLQLCWIFWIPGVGGLSPYQLA